MDCLPLTDVHDYTGARILGLPGFAAPRRKTAKAAKFYSPTLSNGSHHGVKYNINSYCNILLLNVKIITNLVDQFFL
jgi:hypothetical protein